MSAQKNTTQKTSTFSFGNFVVASLSLVMLGFVYVLLTNTAPTASATTDLMKEMDQRNHNQSLTNVELREQIAVLASRASNLEAVDRHLYAQQTEQDMITGNSIGDNFDKAVKDSEIKAAALDSELKSEMMALFNALKADQMAAKPEAPKKVVDTSGMSEQIAALEEALANLKNQMANDKVELEMAMSNGVASMGSGLARLAGEVQVSQTNSEIQLAESAKASTKNATDIQTLTDGMMAMNDLNLSMVGNYAELHSDVDDLERVHKKLAARADEIELKALSSANRLLAVSRLRDALEADKAFNSDLENLKRYAEEGSSLDKLIGDLEPISNEEIDSLASLQTTFQQISNELLAEELAAQVAESSKSDQLKAGFVSFLGVTRQDGSAVISTKESKLETPLGQIKTALDAGDLASAKTGIAALDAVPTDTFTSLTDRLAKRMKIEDAQGKLNAWLVSLGSGSEPK